MKKWRLTEQEMRALANKYAAGQDRMSPGGYSTPDAWVAKYMEHYNKTMEELEKYNQSAN